MSDYSAHIRSIATGIHAVIASEYDGSWGLSHQTYGLRVMTPDPGGDSSQRPTIGAVLPNSYQWSDGESLGEELEGTCAIRLWSANTPGLPQLADIETALSRLRIYWGRHAVLIASDYTGDYGQDVGEIIMKGATVLAVWDHYCQP